MITDAIQRLLRYARAGDKDYGSCFVDAGIADIVEDMMSTNYLAANYKETHVRYNKVGTILINHQSVLAFVGKLR